MSHPETSEVRRTRRSSSRGRRWSRRLSRWPLIRLLIESPAFRLVVLAFSVAVIAAPLMLVRLWRVNPPSVPGSTRISTLDFIQAWSLKRKARDAVSRNDMQNALFAYRAAAANNPADLEALRGGMRTIQRSPAPPELASTALSLGHWLLRMGETNIADVELIGSVWNRCDLHERTAGVLSALTNVTSSAVNQVRAVAYFRSGRVNGFQALLKSDSALDQEVRGVLDRGQARVPSASADREMYLISLAYLAGWGSGAAQREALNRLRELAQEEDTELLANEMLMTVYLQTRDVIGAEEVFRRLQASGRAGVWHVTAYCTLLAREGPSGKAAAKAALEEANLTPKTDAEVLRLVTVLILLGDGDKDLEMYKQADDLCRTYFNDPPWLEQGALIRADLLDRLKRWDEMRQLAYRIRSYQSVNEDLGGFSYFIEGVAELNDGYRANADAAFKRAADLGFPNPRLAVKVAEGLMKLGGATYNRYAETILLKDSVRANFAGDKDYLLSLMQCADANKRSDYLWDTITNLYTLAPNDPVVVNNYAACLLLFRRKPEEAIVHTLRLLQDYPNAPETILNHVVALTMNGRLDEADKLLERILPDQLLKDSVRSQYYLAVFELRLLQGRKEEARNAYREITISQLFPVQTEWLEANLPLLEETGAAPPGTG